MNAIEPLEVDTLVDQALAEDLAHGDLTTRTLFPEPVPARARIIAHAEVVTAGLWLVERVFRRLDDRVTVDRITGEGQRVGAGTALAELRGDGRALLSGERTALNFLQRLSGIATLTARYIQAVQGFRVTVLDTRKTTPGWRMLEKYAVRMGGGSNHRLDLGQAMLIKDNHLALLDRAPPRSAQIRAALAQRPPLKPVEIEAKTLDEVDEAIAAGAHTVLLDNMPAALLRAAVERVHGRARTEASGGVTLESIREIAATGVDLISIGALTHSAPAVDLSMDIEPA